MSNLVLRGVPINRIQLIEPSSLKTINFLDYIKSINLETKPLIQTKIKSHTSCEGIYSKLFS